MEHGTSGANFIATQNKYLAAAFSLLAFICSKVAGQVMTAAVNGVLKS